MWVRIFDFRAVGKLGLRPLDLGIEVQLVEAVLSVIINTLQHILCCPKVLYIHDSRCGPCENRQASRTSQSLIKSTSTTHSNHKPLQPPYLPISSAFPQYLLYPSHSAAMPATTAETLSLVTRNVSVAPLVLLSAADHYGRQAKGTRKRVVGVLLGQNDGKNVRVSNSFAGASSFLTCTLHLST